MGQSRARAAAQHRSAEEPPVCTTMLQSAAVAPLPASEAASGLPPTAAISASTAASSCPSSQPAASTDSVASVSSRLPASSSSFHRLSRLERIAVMCSSDSGDGSLVSVGELLVTLAYLSRSLTADESGRVHEIAQTGGCGGSISMRAFSRLIGDCLVREREVEGQALTTCSTEEAHRSFVSFALSCLASHVKDSADLIAVNASVSRQSLTDELAAARQAVRQAEQSNKQLTDRLDRLQTHCRRIEEDNTRLTGQQQASSSRQSSDSEALQSLQAAGQHYQLVIQRLTAALQQNEAALTAARSEHQSSLALLQFERSAKQSLQHEMAAAAEQILALQAGRSSEMRQALKRKKEEMAAIMDSHRYTKELKAQAMRVPQLEQDGAALRATVGQLQDDVAEYKRLLNEWQIAGGDGPQTASTRSRPAFSLCDDLDMDGNSNVGPASLPVSAANSRRASVTANSTSTALAAMELRLVEQSHELDVLKVELVNAQRSGERLTAQRDALVLHVKQVSEHSELAERQQAVCETRLVEQTDLLHESEEQCLQLQQQLSELQLTEQRWQARLSEWEAERLRLTAEHAAAVEALQQAGRDKERSWQAAMDAAAAKLAKLESLMQLLNDDHNSAKRQMDEAHTKELQRLTAEREQWQQRVEALRAEMAQWQRAAEEADALRRSQLTAANDSTEASRLMAERLAEQRASLERQAAQADKERREAEQRLRDVQERLDELSALHSSALAQLSAVRSELSSSSASLSASEAKLRRLELLYPATVDELEAVRRRVAELEERVRQLEADKARLQAQIDSHVCSAAVVQLTEASAAQPQTGSLAAAVERPHALQVNETALPSQSSLVQPPTAAVWRNVPLSASQQTEVRAYGTFINQRLQSDSDVAHLLPVRCDNGELLAKLGDGLLLAKLLNVAQPALIDERVLNRRQAGQVLAWQQIAQNLNIVISAAKSIGVSMRQTAVLGAAAADKQPAAATFTPLQVMDESQLLTGDVDVIDAAASTRLSTASVVVNSAGTNGRSGSLSQYRSALQTARQNGSMDEEAEAASSLQLGQQRRSTVSDGFDPSSQYASGATGRALDAGSAQAQFSECTQPALVIDFIHQIVRHSLTHNLDTKHNPRLLGLTLLPVASTRASITVSAVATLSSDALACLPHDALLLRWANFHVLTAQALHPTNKLEPLTAAGAPMESGVALHCILDAMLAFQLSRQVNTAAAGSSRDIAAALSPWQTLAGDKEALLQSLFSRLQAMNVLHFHTAAALSAEHERLQMLLLATPLSALRCPT